MNAWIVAVNALAGGWAGAVWRAAWQGGVAIALVWAVCRAWPRLPAGVRCWLWRLAVLKLLLALAWSRPVALPLLPAGGGGVWEYGRVGVPQHGGVGVRAPNTPADRSPGHDRIRLDAPGAVEGGQSEGAGPVDSGMTPAAWLLLLWLGGVGWQVRSLAIGRRRVRRLLVACEPLREGDLRREGEDLCRRFGARRPPRLALCREGAGPLLVGTLRPTSVLPAWVPERCVPADQRLLLAHEVAHLRRRDLIWGWLPALARVLFFFHPLVWLAGREWRRAQEMACDETVVNAGGAPAAEYGRALLRVAQECVPRPAPELAGAGVVESYEVLRERLTAMREIRGVTRKRLAVVGLAIAGLGAASLIPWRVVARQGPSASAGEAAAAAPARGGEEGLRTVTIHGRVTNEAGKPVAGATVQVFDRAPYDQRLLGTKMTGPDGSYRFDGLRFPVEDQGNVRATVIVTHPEYGVGGLNGIALRGREVDLPFTLYPAAALEGVVADQAGKPLAGATATAVLVSRPDQFLSTTAIPEALRPRFSAHSDGGGAFTIGGLPRGSRVSIKVSAPGFATYYDHTILSEQGTTPRVTVRLRPGGEITGRVVYEGTGKPAVGLRVFCQVQDRAHVARSFPKDVLLLADAVTDARGRYNLRGLAPAPWNVMLLLPEPQPTEWTAAAAEGVSVTAGKITEGVDLKLVKGSLLTIRTANARTGAPVPDVGVGYHGAARPESSAAILVLTTNAKGRGQIRVPTGPAYFYIARPVQGWYLREQKVSAKVTVSAGKPQTVTLALDPLAAVAGTVVDETGRPVAAALLFRAWGSESVFLGFSDAPGGFLIRGFKPGAEVTLRAKKEGRATREWPTVRADEETPPLAVLRLQEYDGGVLRGRVVGEDGKPVSGALITAAGQRGNERRSEEGEHSFLTTDAEGRYEIREVWAGWRYTVTASKPGHGGAKSEPVLARAGAVNEVPDIVLPRKAGGPIRPPDTRSAAPSPSPWIGIMYRAVTPQVRKHFGLPTAEGVVVMGLPGGTAAPTRAHPPSNQPERVVVKAVPDSPAARAGLQPGDLIVAVGGAPIKGLTDLRGQILKHRVGDVVSLRFYRGKEERRVKVRLGVMPRRMSAAPAPQPPARVVDTVVDLPATPAP
ncbi:MAG: carboxypeptidase regulatory-like domain-containing protein [Armatimonadetes bacterium]|nr:carboxypeptidase regulatory-like domain-containing protein [Armatimonadota bacterium]